MEGLMRYTARLMVATLFSLAACGGGMTSPGGGGGGGGAVGQVVVGNIFFRSAHNGSQNAAVDTMPAGSTVTWAWNAAGAHSIQSTGQEPGIYRNSAVLSGATATSTRTVEHP